MKRKIKLLKIFCFVNKAGLVCFIFLIFFLINPAEINAQERVAPKIAVYPEKFELEVKRGQYLEDDITTLNKSEVALPIEARVLNFTAEDYTGTIMFSPEMFGISPEEERDISFDPAKWITLKNPNFILDPNEKNKVEFSVNIPENAEPGGHYAVLLFEPKLPSFYFEEGQPKVLPIIGVLILFSVEVEGTTRPEESLTITDFTIPENLHLKRLEQIITNITGLFPEARAAEKEKINIVKTSHLPFTLYIKNNDIVHLKPSGKLEILTMSKKRVGETEIQKTTILPGKIRQFPVEFKPKLPEKIEKYLPGFISNFISQNFLFGKFQANLSLEFEKDIINREFEFWVFPWKVWLSTFLAIVVFTLFIVKYRKRLFAAILVLFVRRKGRPGK